MAREESSLTLSSGEIARAEGMYAVKKRLRCIVSLVAGGVPDLVNCSAKRTLCPDGTLLEVIRLDGSEEFLDRKELQKWLMKQPVKMKHPREM